jgi:hypothetical protein
MVKPALLARRLAPRLQLRVPPRLLQKYPLRILPLGFGLRGGPISSQTPFEALEQGKASKSGSELGKGLPQLFRASID